MAKYILLDGDGYRIGKFEADDLLRAFEAATGTLRSGRKDPHRWSLLRETAGSVTYMGGAGPDPKRSEVRRPT